jgi:alpha-glucan,water dikinase
VGHLKEGLIHDFEHFLKTLKAVHSGTDLETAIQAARNGLDGGTQDLMWQIWNRRNDPAEGTVPLVGNITEGRRRLAHLLNDGQQHRELLYLDLALEQLVRTVVERNLHQRLQGEQLGELIGRVLENVMSTQENVELGACLDHWNRLMQVSGENRFKADWSLHAKAVVDRIGRALGTWTNNIYRLLQPKAQVLGHAFGAEPWTISLFSEEVVRGSSLGLLCLCCCSNSARF